jgi:hypothetical protein
MVDKQEGFILLALFLSIFIASCSEKPTTRATHPILADDSDKAEKPPTWASGVHDIGTGPNQRSPRTIDRALVSDPEYSGNQREKVRRVVYRVSLMVPRVFGEKKANFITPAGELYVDVSQDRLRARFVGPGWPVEEGVEVRLRRDAQGVYLFDHNGGQQLGPGKMASWFEGQQHGSSRSSVRVRQERVLTGHGPGDLICALLAEWTAQERDAVVHRCIEGSIPSGFGFGPWRAELTALVPMEIERRRLRADENEPPEEIKNADNRTFMAPSEFARVVPYLATQNAGPIDTNGELQVVNNSSTKVIVVIENIPVAWINAYSEGHISGFRPGRYRIRATRPFGIQLFSPRFIDLPGKLTVGKPTEK